MCSLRDLSFLIYGLKSVLFFSLYVGATVLELPHVCLRERLHYAFATVFCVCFDVRYPFLSTRPSWFNVEIATVCM